MRRPADRFADVVASWSGGIDSTGVAAHLLRNGYRVRLVSLLMYGGEFGEREKEARTKLLPVLRRCADEGGGKLVWHTEQEAPWIWAFSPDGKEIPRRNKHIIDHLLTTYCLSDGIHNIGMGEYIGADSWLVRDHVGGADADHRSLGAYIFNEYGLDYRMFSLADFGESRFKVDRLRLLIEAVGQEDAALTSNCLYDYVEHCGACYKCIERAASFELLGATDLTVYMVDPKAHEAYASYLAQMNGATQSIPFGTFSNPKMPSPV